MSPKQLKYTLDPPKLPSPVQFSDTSPLLLPRPSQICKNKRRLLTDLRTISPTTLSSFKLGVEMIILSISSIENRRNCMHTFSDVDDVSI
ncbi:hypothetical protein CARUB_v10018321mg [Capsella rubella]|uniref:Uncharacterized protein n=1 Tax=Capsella rubella TaxID=81985 RepID=R0FMP5_9BRAS|nr:hypothetical protein CARUB_v10018321mg [Capsella rubella]